MEQFTIKYAPKTLRDVVYHDDKTHDEIMEFENGRFRNIILYGPYGNGKTTIAKLLPYAVAFDVNWQSDVDFKNGSLLNGIDAIREIEVRIKLYTINCRRCNFVIIDEADQLTKAAQLSLKSLMDECAQSAMFIFTTNYLQKIDGGLQTRSLKFQLDPPPSHRLVPLIEKVLESEGLRMPLASMELFARHHGSGVRNLLMELENEVLRHKRLAIRSATSMSCNTTPTSTNSPAQAAQ